MVKAYACPPGSCIPGPKKAAMLAKGSWQPEGPAVERRAASPHQHEASLLKQRGAEGRALIVQPPGLYLKSRADCANGGQIYSQFPDDSSLSNGVLKECMPSGTNYPDNWRDNGGRAQKGGRELGLNYTDFSFPLSALTLNSPWLLTFTVILYPQIAPGQRSKSTTGKLQQGVTRDPPELPRPDSPTQQFY